jgi:NDP-sugar pyrophosphorylase family protein
MAFSGIQVISPKVLSLLKGEGKFSVTPAYLELAKSHEIYAFDHSGGTWHDLGRPKRIIQAQTDSNVKNLIKKL